MTRRPDGLETPAQLRQLPSANWAVVFRQPSSLACSPQGVS